ncbi:MAG: N-acetylmuramoyl-L-alanine amidase [Candidatus Wallbacteria bacterium]|nr:N-acetylmuramoyl-L-alanine amidase [Candidatus Wallbacteria bacterium]
MIRSVGAKTLVTLLVTSAVALGGGMHEGHKVFYQNRFEQNAAAKTAGVSVDPQTRELVLAEGTNHPYVRTGIFMSLPARAARPFSAVFPSWQAEVPESTSLEVAFRFANGDTGPWTRWYPVQREADLELGAIYRFIQFRAILTSDNGDTTPRVSAVSLHFGIVNQDQPPIPAGRVVDLPRPPVVSREQWGARPAKETYTQHVPVILTIHHTSSPTAASYNGPSTIRGIQNYHMDAPTHNWIDIGYHFLVAPDGTIFQGRPELVSGAHCIPNPGKIGICVIGDFQPPSTEQPSDAQYAHLVDLVSHLAGKYGISPQGIGGHRDWMTTDCPGQRLYDRLPEIRAEVGRRIDAAGSK